MYICAYKYIYVKVCASFLCMMGYNKVIVIVIYRQGRDQLLGESKWCIIVTNVDVVVVVERDWIDLSQQQ